MDRIVLATHRWASCRVFLKGSRVSTLSVVERSTKEHHDVGKLMLQAAYGKALVRFEVAATQWPIGPFHMQPIVADAILQLALFDRIRYVYPCAV